MKIIILGGTGFLGREVVNQALNAGHEVTILIHNQELNLKSDRFHQIKTNIFDVQDLINNFQNKDAIINLIGIIKEIKPNVTFNKMHVAVVKNILDAIKFMKEKDSEKKIQLHNISALGVGENAPTKYFLTKWLAEKMIEDKSGKFDFKYNIYRPSIVWGNGGFRDEMKKLVKMPIFTPIVGNGKYRFQPIDVSDLASRIINEIESGATNQIINLVGNKILTLEEIITNLEKELGKKKLHVHIPLFFIQFIASITDFLHIPFPITPDQIKMIQMENIVE